MTQLSVSDAEHAGKRKQTRREVFLAEMENMVPWQALLSQMQAHYPKAGRGHAMETIQRIHLLQQWNTLNDPAMEEALHEIASMRQFGPSVAAGGDPGRDYDSQLPSCAGTAWTGTEVVGRGELLLGW